MAGEPDLSGGPCFLAVLPAMFDTLEADIVILQESKIQRKDLRDDNPTVRL
ncbi:hypothetical protein OQA88_13382 [Cercophora sp. LCS_1]